MSDDTRNDEQGDRPVDPVTGAPVAPDWSLPTGDAPGWPAADGTPTLITPAETAPVEPRPTSVDPTLPPPPPVLPVAPSWSSPSVPAPGAPPPPGGPAPQHPAPGQPVPQYGQYAVPQGVGLPGVGGWGAVPQAPKPGVVPLRPLGLGEILDGAISYIRRDPKTVLGISAVISLVIALFQFIALAATASSFALGAAATTPADAFAGSLGSATASLVQYGVSAVLGVVATGLLTVVMGQAVLGRRVTASQAWDRTKKRFWALLGLTLLISVTVGLMLGVGILLAVLVGWALSQASIGFGILVGVVLGLGVLAFVTWVYLRLLLAPVALILENAGITQSMRRSWALVQGAWWRTFGIYLLGSILAGIVSSVLAIPFALVGTVASIGALENGELPLTYTIATSLATLVSSTVVLPFTSGIVSLLYIDRRIRREALDIELARAAGLPG
jgi:hypothetical protein